MLVFDQLKRNDPQLQLLSILLCASLAVLFAGLWWVQIVNAGRYQESLEIQSFRSVRLPAVRGKILDRNGVVLADNRPSYNINLYLEDLSAAFKKEYTRSRPRRVVTNDLPFWKDWLGFTSVTTQFVKLKDDPAKTVARDSRYRVANGVVSQVADVLQAPLTFGLHEFLSALRNAPLAAVSRGQQSLQSSSRAVRGRILQRARVGSGGATPASLPLRLDRRPCSGLPAQGRQLRPMAKRHSSGIACPTTAGWWELKAASTSNCADAQGQNPCR